jgi:preprotein translocase subunit SecE
MSDTTNDRPQSKRTGPAQFLKEVRTELRRVAWPSRGEVVQYSLIVLVTTILIGAFIFGMDQLFGQLVFWIYG